MSGAPLEILTDEQALALAHTPAPMHDALEVYFALDRRLAQIVSKTTEPMLGQMRIAWWRDMLTKPEAERPSGDAVLDAIGRHWSESSQKLQPLIDAWEILVAEDGLSDELILDFGRGRGAPFAELLSTSDTTRSDAAGEAATLWALADAAAHISGGDERARFVTVAKGLNNRIVTLPHPMRGLAVLRALSLRAIEAGGGPLMQGRGAGLVAFRAALLGR